nr:MAG TPA: Protein of unknown function (DUF4497) [Caudoviricetes sp.]
MQKSCGFRKSPAVSPASGAFLRLSCIGECINHSRGHEH